MDWNTRRMNLVSAGLYALGALSGTRGMYATFAGELDGFTLGVLAFGFVTLWSGLVAEGIESIN
jgi:hypothetical protein